MLQHHPFFGTGRVEGNRSNLHCVGKHSPSFHPSQNEFTVHIQCGLFRRCVLRMERERETDRQTETEKTLFYEGSGGETDRQTEIENE